MSIFKDSFRNLGIYGFVALVCGAVLFLLARHASHSYYVLPDGMGVAFLVFGLLLAIVGVLREVICIAREFIARIDMGSPNGVYFLVYSILLTFSLPAFIMQVLKRNDGAQSLIIWGFITLLILALFVDSVLAIARTKTHE